MRMTDRLAADPSSTADIIYVSWGGTGRGASLRRAYRAASDQNRGLVYLAILDEEHFDDLDPSLLRTVSDELSWLLDAQIRLIQNELGLDVATKIMVRSGDIDNEVTEVIKLVGTDRVLIGAPIPLSQHTSVDEFGAILSDRTGATIEVVEPAAFPDS